MAEHRVRLTDEDVQLIVAALSARTAALQGKRRLQTFWLMWRLAEMSPGNPRLKLGGGASGPSTVTSWPRTLVAW